MPESQVAISNDTFFPEEIPDRYKKSIGIVQIAMGNLGLAHRKFLNIACANAYSGIESGKSRFRIRASTLVQLAEYNSNNYQAIYDIFEELRVTQVKSVDFDGKAKPTKRNRKISTTGLISSFTIMENGIIEYEFSSDMLKHLKDPDQYIWMVISAQNRFSSKYELTLFENCLRYIGVGSTGIKKVEKWREILGAQAPIYDEYKNFNRKIIQKATEGVNTKSQLLIKPFVTRKNRKIDGLGFSVKENPQENIFDFENHKTIRNTGMYKSLISNGLKDVEAIYWIENKGEDYVSETLEYINARKSIRDLRGYTLDTLTKGYGEQPAEVRERDRELKQEAVTKRLEDRINLQLALEYTELEKLCELSRNKLQTNLAKRISASSDCAIITNEFIKTLKHGIFEREFEKRGWLSPMLSKSIMEFLAQHFDEKIPTIDSDGIENFEQLKLAHANMKNGIYKEKFETISKKDTSNLAKIMDIVDVIFPHMKE